MKTLRKIGRRILPSNVRALLRLAQKGGACTWYRARRTMDPAVRSAFAGFVSSLERPLIEPPAGSDSLIARLLQLYKSQTAESVSSLYRYGAIWEFDVRDRRGEYLEACHAGDPARLENLLRVFHRNGGCAGIAPGPEFWRQFESDSYFRDAWVAKLVAKYRKFAAMAPPAFSQLCHESPVGGPVVVPYKDRHLTWNVVRQAYYCWRIHHATACDPGRRMIVLELGTGYGSQARLWKTWAPKSAYILLDIPEVLLVASFALAVHFPSMRLGFMDDVLNGDVSAEKLRSYDFVFLPHWAIERLPDFLADLTINTGSLAEMDADIVQNYLAHIQRLTRPGGHFYTCNRRKGEINTGGFLEFGMDQWQLDSSVWRPLLDGHSWGDVWFEDAEHRELLLQRT